MWWIQPVLTVVLGALLGAENLNAPEASGWLRVPALIAALILVAQGLLDFETERRLQREQRELKKRETRETTARRETSPASPDVPQPPREITSTPAPTPGTRELASVEATATQRSIVAIENDAKAQAQEQSARQAAAATVRESSGAVLAILILAVWLGLATLSYSTAPASLLGLSLIASFLLFSSAWSMLQQRRA